MEEREFSDISYRRFLDEERLMGSKCKGCDSLYLPPRPICIECHSSDMAWVEMGGKGKLRGFTSISIGPPFMVKQGYNRKNPYCVGVVELDEGVKIVARILDVDARKPETIKVGTPVVCVYLHYGKGENARTYLGFRPTLLRSER